MGDQVHTISQKDLDNFQGKSTASTGWFHLYQEQLKRKLYTLEPDFYKKLFEKNIQGQKIK